MKFMQQLLIGIAVGIIVCCLLKTLLSVVVLVCLSGLAYLYVRQQQD